MSTAFFGTVIALGRNPEVLERDPEALIMDLQDTLDMRLPRLTVSRILASIAAYTTDAVYTELDAFISFCNLANMQVMPVTDVFDPADAYEIAWARVELTIIDPVQEEKLLPRDNPFMDKQTRAVVAEPTFSEEILRYCGAAIKQEGVSKPIFSIPDAIMPASDTDLIDEILVQAEFGRHKEVEQSIADYVMDNATILFEQLRELSAVSGEPLLTEEMENSLRELLTNTDEASSQS